MAQTLRPTFPNKKKERKRKNFLKPLFKHGTASKAFQQQNLTSTVQQCKRSSAVRAHLKNLIINIVREQHGVLAINLQTRSL